MITVSQAAIQVSITAIQSNLSVLLQPVILMNDLEAAEVSYPDHPHPKVSTEVPLGALFTDTIYDDTDVNVEELIFGKVIKATTVATYDLDFSLGSHWDLSLTTVDTTLGITNPTATNLSTSKTITARSTAGEVLLVPASWIIIGTYNSDGSENLMTLTYANVDSVIEIRLYINEETV